MRLIEEMKRISEIREIIEQVPSEDDESIDGTGESKIHQAVTLAELANEELTGFYFKELIDK